MTTSPPVLSSRALLLTAALCWFPAGCRPDPDDLSVVLINDAESITSIIHEHLDLRNSSPRNCGKVAGKLLAYVESNKPRLLGLHKRLEKLSLPERRRLKAEMAQLKYGALVVEMNRAKAQFAKQCPARAEAIEGLIDRIRRAPLNSLR